MTVPKPSKQTVSFASNAVWQKIKRHKKGLVFLLLFLILGVTASMVPVGKIPLLRNMAWAMGYTPEETEQISFLSALFHWKDVNSFRASISAEDDFSVFDKQGLGAGQSGGGLINWRAVNAQRARQGLPPLALANAQAAARAKAQEEMQAGGARGATVRVPSGVITQLAGAQAGTDVFFGQETPANPRNPQDGFDTSLKVAKRAGIIGGQKVDSLGQVLDKAALKDTENLAALMGVSGGTGLSNLGQIGRLSKNKGSQDLGFAYLVGGVGKKVSNPILGKTLATTSFLGDELPKQVFAAGGDGIMIDPNTVNLDVTDFKEKEKLEEKCGEATSSSGKVITSKLEDASAVITKDLRGGFPSNTCDPAQLNAWVGQLGTVESGCREAQNAYRNIEKGCNVRVKQMGSCDALRLRDMAQTQKGVCLKLAEEKTAAGESVDLTTLDPSKGSETVPGTGYTPAKVAENVNGQFNIALGGKSGMEGDGFFPQPREGMQGQGDEITTKLLDQINRVK